MIELRFCKKCLYPSIAVNLRLDDDKICSSCRGFEKMNALPESFWKERREQFQKYLQKNKLSSHMRIVVKK